jgi:predicted flap endonuclease-1-like 5' DNA nuclease
MRSIYRTLIIPILIVLMLSGFTRRFQDNRQFGGLAWWIWLSFLVLLIAVVAFWAWSKARAQTAEPPDRTEWEEPDRVGINPKAAQTEAAAPMRPDDLTIVAGIDSSISETLKDNGIHTLSELARTSYGRLNAILEGAGLEADPGSWAEQARLAAEGEWDELENFQDSLKFD